MGFLITTLIFIAVGVIASLFARICCNRGPSTNLKFDWHTSLYIFEVPSLWLVLYEYGISHLSNLNHS
ncbi:hypothetical protein MKX01_000760 [Papaver californicum]|nr:hypothetical protein MKX01_000760 [Papaver californicum]